MPEKPKSLTPLWHPPAQEYVQLSKRVRDPWYHTARWKKEAREFLRLNPLCKRCEERGKIEAAHVVDHIIPKDICPDPWDHSNWQGLCRKCHAIKSAIDKKYFKK